MASDPPSCRLLGGDLRRYAPTLPAQQATGKTEFTERTIHNYMFFLILFKISQRFYIGKSIANHGVV
ncbi:MAG: hypothetical protein ACK4FP_14550, partial [Azonexus sp.]